MADSDEKSWDEGHLPPPWEAEEVRGGGSYRVVCHGYNDETPVVCVGSMNWPLSRDDALILAASLDLLAACERMEAAYAKGWVNLSEAEAVEIHGARKLAIAKARGQ